MNRHMPRSAPLARRASLYSRIWLFQLMTEYSWKPANGACQGEKIE